MFGALIDRMHGAIGRPFNVSPSSNDEGVTLPEPWFTYQDTYEQPRLIPKSVDAVDSTGKLICQQQAYDKIINDTIINAIVQL